MPGHHSLLHQQQPQGQYDIMQPDSWDGNMLNMTFLFNKGVTWTEFMVTCNRSMNANCTHLLARLGSYFQISGALEVWVLLQKMTSYYVGCHLRA